MEKRAPMFQKRAFCRGLKCVQKLSEQVSNPTFESQMHSQASLPGTVYPDAQCMVYLPTFG